MIDRIIRAYFGDRGPAIVVTLYTLAISLSGEIVASRLLSDDRLLSGKNAWAFFAALFFAASSAYIVRGEAELKRLSKIDYVGAATAEDVRNRESAAIASAIDNKREFMPMFWAAACCIAFAIIFLAGMR
jgi:hypothetical protein